LTAFGEEIGFAPTLTESLDQVFGGDAGAEGGDADVVDEVPEGEEPTEPEGTTEVDAAAQQRLTAALGDANQALQDGQAALAEGDWTAYGEAQSRLQAALEEAAQAQTELDAAAGDVPPVDDGETAPADDG